MSPRCFFDTNVFIYILDQKAAAKRDRAEELIRSTVKAKAAVASYQVVQEFLNVASTKFRKQLTPDEALRYALRLIWPMCNTYPTPGLYAKALDVQTKTNWIFYDSLIVASALAEECVILYTEDLQHDRVFESLRICNPFV